MSKHDGGIWPAGATPAAWTHRGSPEAAGYATGAPLPAVGRARRAVLPDGAELWRLAPPDAMIAARIVGLGRQGIGAWVAAGTDARGSWFVRHVSGRPTLHETLQARGPEPMPWPDAVAMACALAQCLAQTEAASLVPGPLTPKQILVGPPVAWVAERLVFALVGEPSVRMDAGSAALSRWVAPEQAAGAPWDAAANRYVLGLLLYRMLSGHHPFAGQGLRRRLQTQAGAGPPPFSEAIAHRLPPGLQALTLRMLAPESAGRPVSAQAIGAELRAFVPSAPTVASGPQTALAPDATTPRTRVAQPAASAPAFRTAGGWAPRALAWTPVAIGVGLAFALTGAVRPREQRTPTPPTVTPASPLRAAQTRADDCSACHPEQTAQWHLSVMAHAAKSPLFQSLEMLIEEQVGKRFDCPEGAGILRRVDERTACRDPNTGIAITGSGGEHWCVNCHAPGNNLVAAVPAWDGLGRGSRSRRPLVDLLPASTMDGIDCAFCHQVHGPVRPGDAQRGAYEGNPDWISTATGRRFLSRPEDRQGRFGIANSGYTLDPDGFLVQGGTGASTGAGRLVPGGAHLRPSAAAKAYLSSSEFCGACHDVRLFGTDVVGGRQGEHFKRLRNAYSEWTRWADDERRAGRKAASCQDCHMSAFPGVCVEGTEPAPPPSASALTRACPDGTHFEARAPGTAPTGLVSTASGDVAPLSTHYFSGVDVPLSEAFAAALVDDPSLDAAGIPRGAQPRRDLLLGRTFRFEVDNPRRNGARLLVPIVLENVGAGHRVPAGFSQEREFWVHLKVSDATGRVLYEVGRVDRGDEDLHDKIFVRVNTGDTFVDDLGRPLGLFGADVVDGPDAPQWSPPPTRGGTQFRGRGLINLQNGFLRCVTCIGVLDRRGECQPRPGQGRTRADRFEDGVYDIDTGICQSNLVGEAALLETYFPVGGLDATRGLTKGPDAIIDRRSAPPGVPLRYVYELRAGNAPGPLTVQARLLFRALPPFLVRAFADYEARQAARGRRPSGPLVTHAMLERLTVVELHRIEVAVP